MSRVVAAEFFVTVSMSDLVQWAGDDAETFRPNPHLAAALEEARLSVDVGILYSQYFDEILLGRGDVYKFSSIENEGAVFVIDLYRGITDQQDVVSFGLSCGTAKAPVVATHLHAFFMQASLQGSFEQSWQSERLRSLIDPARYPSVMQESGYVQRLVST